MSARTETAFSVLVGLDPLGGVTGSNRSASFVDPIGSDAEACLARIVAMPRPGAITATPARHAPEWTSSSHRRRIRYGAIGLVASAAIATITTILWASPSAGAPPGQAINVAQVGQMLSLPPT